MSKWKVFALCAIVCVSVGDAASAATWTLNGAVSTAIDPVTGAATPGFVATGTPSLAVTVPNHSGNNQYKLDFYISMANPSATDGLGTTPDHTVRGFGNIDWSATLTAGLNAFDTASPNTQGDGWQADQSLIDTNGGSHTSGTAALWGDNKDFGAFSNDLQDILQSLAVIASPNTADPRPFVGTVLPNATVEGDVTGVPGTKQTQWSQTLNRTYVGSLYVDWNGTTTDTLTATFFQVSYEMQDGSLVQDKGTSSQGLGGNFSTARVFQSVQFTFQGVPEPATLAMAAMAVPCLALAIRRRRRRC